MVDFTGTLIVSYAHHNERSCNLLTMRGEGGDDERRLNMGKAYDQDWCVVGVD